MQQKIYVANAVTQRHFAQAPAENYMHEEKEKKPTSIWSQLGVTRAGGYQAWKREHVQQQNAMEKKKYNY